jgi:integrase
MKLTQANVTKAKLPAGKSEGFYWDDEMPGFGLRLRGGGSRTFIVQYKIGAKHRRMTLGNAFKVTADDARKQARQIFGKVADGKDPANERATRVAEASTGFGATVADFLEAQAGRIRPRTLAETTRYLNKSFKPLHGLSLASITRAIVAAELRRVAKESGPVAADCARSKLAGFFAWAVGEGLRDDNPVIGTNKAAPDNQRRDRVLTDAEVVSIWNAADPANDAGKIVRLLFTTACRRNEIGGLKPNEIVLRDALIALPGDRTKNGLPHDVPLSGLAREIVESLAADGNERVFGRGAGGFNNWDRAKQELDAASGVAGWTLHDIRRTVATRMGDLGVQPHIIESVLNHISGHRAGVAGIYQRSTYAKEKRAALDTWASHLETLLAGAANVVRLKTA